MKYRKKYKIEHHPNHKYYYVYGMGGRTRYSYIKIEWAELGILVNFQKMKYRIINYNLPYGNYGLRRGSKYYGTFFFLTTLENTI